MDISEVVPCVVDNLGSGRIATSVLPSVSSSTIIKPQIKERRQWLSECPVDRFDMPRHRIRSQKKEPESVRYSADMLDVIWMSRMTCGGRTEGSGKAGPASGTIDVEFNVTASDDAYLDILEDVFTLLEVTAYRNYSIPVDRVTIDPKQIGHDVAHLMIVRLESIREYWLAKRRANGGLPLIPALWPTPSEDTICDANVLGGCPLPFYARQGAMYAVVRSEVEPSETRSQHFRRFASHSKALANAVLRREELLFEHARSTLYEMAALRQTITLQ